MNMKLFWYVKKYVHKALDRIRPFANRSKESHELCYWTARKNHEGLLSNNHYEYFYTIHFGLNKGYYKAKKILDIGCGPRGSLEWANMASRRIGLDPLAKSYRKLGTYKHKMKYVCAHVEKIPFSDNYMDVIASFNSLDHVDDISKAIREIIRVLSVGGFFLLLTDVNHAPTPTEPIAYSWNIIDAFAQDLRIIDVKHYEKKEDGMYDSILTGIPYDHNINTRHTGVLSAKFVKDANKVAS